MPPTDTSDTRRRKLTPPQLAKLWGISCDKVISWVRSGELRAIDVSTRRGGRPRWLIDVSDIATFEAARAAVPTVPVQRRRKATADVVEFFA